MQYGVRCKAGSRGAWGGGGGRAACTGGSPYSRLGGQGTRGAHREHAVHVRDLGRVKAHQLVERRRALPSRKEGTRCGARCVDREAGGRGGGGASGVHGEGPTQGVRVRARAKRTSNICFMSVTLEVSKLTGWLNADAPCRVEGGHVQYGTRCGQVGAGGRGGGGASGMHGEKARPKAWGPGHARSARRTSGAWS